MKLKHFFFLFSLLSISNLSAQYYNNIYNYTGSTEFQQDIHLLGDGNLIEIGAGRIDKVGLIIRKIDGVGNLIWSDYIASDSLYLYTAWTHTSTIVDSILFVMATAQKFEIYGSVITYPYFIKYNLNQQKLIDLKFYPRELEHSIYSMVYHTDGYLYGAGHEYLFDGRSNRDILIMKLDTAGNLIWEKNLNLDGKINQLFEIESFDNQLIISGFVSTDITRTMLAKIDTAANLIKQHIAQPFASNGGIEIEVYQNEIYFTTTSNTELEDYETQYLAKFTADLQIVWDTLIPNTSRYDINCRDIEILNDEIIMTHNIRKADAFTNKNDWSYASSWSTEGEFNWEHVYFYDSTYTHHLDDIEATPEGDLIFMGTVFGRHPNTAATQFLWLFKTDAQGCGTVQDTCYYTLDRYFGLDSTVYTIDLDTIVNIIGADTLVSIQEADTTVHLIENIQTSFIQVLGNPFNEVLQIESNLLAANQYQIQICNLQGQVIYDDPLSNHQQLQTPHWAKGIYLLNLFKEGRLLFSEKLVKQ